MARDGNLLVGVGHSDDAAVYRLSADTALVQTVDLLTPIVRDPSTFGAVAAANALSDVYAMGGRPLTALNIMGFPMGKLDLSVMCAIAEGGFRKMAESGTMVCGGHSIKDSEIKFGFAVTGLVHPEKYLSNTMAKPNDAVVLTKPIGTGIIATALKEGLASQADEDAIALSMTTLNNKASEIMIACGAHTCTDITGFGLFGHAIEIAMASNLCVEIDTSKVPLFDKVLEYHSRGCYPGGGRANRDYFKARLTLGGPLQENILDVMFDPQTSGGLLIFIEEKNASALLRRLKDEGISAALIGRTSPSPAQSLKYF